MSSFDRLFGRFSRDTRGAAAMIFGIAMIPVMGLIGAALDYSRASEVRTALQEASDATALAAAHFVNIESDREFQAQARAFFDAQMEQRTGFTVTSVVIERFTDALVTVHARGEVDTTIMSLMGVDEIDVGVEAAADTAGGAVEIALALDNTGSMRQEIGDLRDAAQTFVDIVTMNGANEEARIALVPYVAAVNIGNTATTQQWLDIDGYSPHHAELMENRRIGRLEEPRCEEPSSGGGGGGGGGGRPRGSVNDGASILPSSPFGRHLEEILGIREAAAATPYTEVWTQGGCIARNPERISHWRLFQLVDGTDWKGCVEARPAPYDVTDEAPSTSNPSTLFVPYFWMDDLDGFTTRIANYGYVNDWVDDGPFLPDTDTEWDMWPRHFNVLKYRPGNPTRIDEVAPDTLGPNKACADPILPLTNDYGMISRRIDQLTVWNRGGTVASEGVAWAWRALSPTPPFTEGAAYGETLKIIIIMTDGQNMTLENPNDVPLADYSAYGYMRDGRVGQENFPQWTRFLNERLQLVCENAKQSGVLIYAVTFGLTDPVQRRMWDECASEPSMAYHVDFASELETAYRQIAASIGRLRLVR